MKEWFIVGMVVVAGGWLVWFGDNHGLSAKRIADIKAELVKTNARLATYTTKDDQAAIDADALRGEGYQKALADLGTADKCVVTPAMSKAFGRIAR